MAVPARPIANSPVQPGNCPSRYVGASAFMRLHDAISTENRAFPGSRRELARPDTGKTPVMPTLPADRESALSDFRFLLIHDNRRFALEDYVLADDDLFDPLLARHIVHDVKHRLFQNGAKSSSPALALDRLACHGT